MVIKEELYEKLLRRLDRIEANYKIMYNEMYTRIRRLELDQKNVSTK